MKNFKGLAAWAKCKVNFARSPAKFAQAMNKFAPGSTVDSCSVTQTVLSMVLTPGKAPTNPAVQRTTGGQFNTLDATRQVEGLLNGDNVIYLSVSPNHYFTVVPLSDSEIGLLQGFQDSYNLHEWLAARDDGVMKKAFFIENFYNLFSTSKHTSIEAAVNLFGIPGKEDEIRDWFMTSNVRLTQLAICAL